MIDCFLDAIKLMLDRNMDTDIIGYSTHLKLGWVSHAAQNSAWVH